MTINLSKGESLNLTKAAPGLTKVMLGAGWDVQGDGIDLDLWTAATKDGKALNADAFCYFGKKTTASMVHSGDNLTGAGEGDDEVITVDLSKVPAEADAVQIGVSFYNHNGRNMGVVDNAFVRAVNTADNAELAKAVITGGGTGKTLYFAKLVRGPDGWTMQAVNEYSPDGLAEGDVTKKLGLN